MPSGAVIKAGEVLQPVWAAANLDPDAFPDPLTVDFRRSPNRHIGFGSGFHRCLGIHLARMELVIAWRNGTSGSPDRIRSMDDLTQSIYHIHKVANLPFGFGATLTEPG